MIWEHGGGHNLLETAFLDSSLSQLTVSFSSLGKMDRNPLTFLNLEAKDTDNRFGCQAPEGSGQKGKPSLTLHALLQTSCLITSRGPNPTSPSGKTVGQAGAAELQAAQYWPGAGLGLETDATLPSWARLPLWRLHHLPCGLELLTSLHL